MNKIKKSVPKFDRAAKVRALQLRSGLPAQPNNKKYSVRELSRRVTKELGRYVSHSTISDWIKNKERIMIQPEAETSSARHWKLKRNKQCHLISQDKLELEKQIDIELDGLFLRGNVTLRNLTELARKLASDRGMLKNPLTLEESGVVSFAAGVNCRIDEF